jgi:hypothetical protein
LCNRQVRRRLKVARALAANGKVSPDGHDFLLAAILADHHHGHFTRILIHLRH